MLSLPVPAQSESNFRRPNWDRVLALQTAAMGDSGAQRDEWFRELREGDSEALLQSIMQFSAAGELASPVREQQLFLFTVALADFPAEQVPARLLEFLANYSPQTLVAHEESENNAVALFNIPAAARGVQYALARQQGEIHAAALLAAPADRWIDQYLAASPAAKAGFLDALEFASGAEIAGLDRKVQGLLSDQPALTTVAARTALAAVDVSSMRHVLESGSGPAVTAMLRAVTGTLATHDRAELLLASIESAPAQNAALAIALLSPGLQAVPQVISTLFDLLGDPELGSAAALALMGFDEAGIRSQLLLLSGSKSLAATRARMAIQLGESAAMQGAQQ
ncbi:MAG: hypothetical protein EXR85_01780 [Xanthomonadales bacterium]|nr:hypothetical protein [Xanthomonadales bacterium]